MNKDNFRTWIKLFTQAWEDEDSDKFKAIFSEDAEYYSDPFENSVSGKTNITNALLSEVALQQDLKIGYEILSFDKNLGVCRFWGKFINTTSENLIKLDGILVCFFDNNICKTIKRWQLESDK